MTSSPCVLVDSSAFTGQEIADFSKQLSQRGAITVVLPCPSKIGHKVLLTALAGRAGWLITTDPAWLEPAATAGLVGVIVVGDPLPVVTDNGSLVVGTARILAEAPWSMVPRDGGCWHAAN